VKPSKTGNGAPRVGVELEERTLAFAERAIVLTDRFPRTDAATIVGRQLLRAGTSIGANYREANRAEAKDDFAPKIAVALKEAAALSTEVGESIAILTTIRRRTREGRS